MNLTIETPNPPNGVVSAAYSFTEAAAGGSGTGYTWSYTGTIPTSLSLSSAGALTGTPTVANTFIYTVQVTDSLGNIARANRTIIIYASSSLSITTTSPLAGGAVGVAYSVPLAATGGSGTGYVWSTYSGSVPGLTLSTRGVLSGNPTTTGTFTIDAQVTDSAGNISAPKAFSVTISSSGGALAVTTTSLTPGTNGTAYSTTLGATGGTGTGYTWGLASGSPALPSWLSLSSGGVLSGTPTATGNFSFTVQVTDSGSNTAIQALTLTIAAASGGTVTMYVISQIVISQDPDAVKITVPG